MSKSCHKDKPSELLQLREKVSWPARQLSAFIEQVTSKGVVERAFFGFHDPRFPDEMQRNGGFDEFAEFADLYHEVYRSELNEKYLKNNSAPRKSGLFKQETDIDLAVRALDSIVLTLDGKKGPLNDSEEANNFVVFLTNYKNGESLFNYVMERVIEKT